MFKALHVLLLLFTGHSVLTSPVFANFPFQCQKAHNLKTQDQALWAENGLPNDSSLEHILAVARLM